jgi:AbrB family looped-hinge helix DNA binding protein
MLAFACLTEFPSPYTPGKSSLYAQYFRPSRSTVMGQMYISMPRDYHEIPMARARSVLQESVPVGARCRITIPSPIARALGLKSGDHMLIRLVGRRLELVPIPKDQLWFWTPKWQKKEREVDRDIARGHVKETRSVEELLQDLKS